MNREQLIKKFFEFFKSKNHQIIENASLVPKEDPTVLFTTAGMHPLVPFLLGQIHPQGKRLVGLQKCIRTNDIEEVGDETHHTFFEMLGNWSLGDYEKKQAIEYSFEFLTKILKIPKEKISVTCFKGNEDAPRDNESAETWKSLGIKKIKFLDKKDNWWGPAGSTGPCGPDTEMFVDEIEMWNDVFMEYNKNEKGKYSPAEQKNIDTGMGVERTLAILNNLEDNYLTELWQPIIKKIENLYRIRYSSEENKKTIRIVADHIKAAVFIVSEGIIPSNKEHGYVLRKLIRRAYIQINKLEKSKKSLTPLINKIFEIYPDYKHLQEKKEFIIKIIKEEENKFENTLDKGLKIFEKLTKNKKHLSGKDSFLLFQSYGFPLETIKDLCIDKKIKFEEENFQKEFEKHQELSQTASAGKFKSGLADNSTETTKLHTATHLLLAALRKILKDDKIIQRGSNITKDRLRLDFSFSRKIEKHELKKIEELVNEIIKKSIPIEKQEMKTKDALKQGAIGTFGEKYPDKISVYSIKKFSKEICAGPHVKNTNELGQFKIIKEGSSSAGVRRIKAILE